MATHIPIDVIRDMEKHIEGMRAAALTCRELAQHKQAQANTLEHEANRLEVVLEKWKQQFPD